MEIKACLGNVVNIIALKLSFVRFHAHSKPLPSEILELQHSAGCARGTVPTCGQVQVKRFEGAEVIQVLLVLRSQGAQPQSRVGLGLADVSQDRAGDRNSTAYGGLRQAC